MSSAAANGHTLDDEYRKQLILAQVQIMELEDARDELATEIAATRELLTRCQALADEKIDAVEHLGRVQADLENEFRHLRHVQHVTNEALNDTRARLAAEQEAAGALRAETAAHRGTIAELTAALAAQRRDNDSLRADNAAGAARIGELDRAGATLARRIVELDTALLAANALAAERLARIEVLAAEQRAMKASRSWRWTSPIRSLERWWARRRRP